MSTKLLGDKFYASALPDEPMFVLLARDPDAPVFVRDWSFTRARAIDAGLRPEEDRAQVSEARTTALAMEKWRADNDGAWRVAQTGVATDFEALDSAWADVRRFHITFGHPAPGAPVMQDPALAAKRGGWVSSEVQELIDARTLVDQADAYIDIIYFAVGGLVELGLRPKLLWDAVQRANMRKLWPDGLAHKDENNRVLKPDGWVGPDDDLIAEINRQLGLPDGAPPEQAQQAAEQNAQPSPPEPASSFGAPDQGPDDPALPKARGMAGQAAQEAPQAAADPAPALPAAAASEPATDAPAQ